jgi:hypothetical protein
VSTLAARGVACAWLGLGGGEAVASGWWSKGSSACVQQRPWFTHVLQKPQSPSLQTSQRQ